MGKMILQIILFLVVGTYLLYAIPQQEEEIKIDSNTFGAIKARAIGPAVMGGRIAALDVVNHNPRIIYVGAASGGVWKSINGGTTFKSVFDKHTQSIGAIAIDQAHPDTVWVGTGECWVRNSVSVGTGIYKSTDGGENWELRGLENSERISKIVINPGKPDEVYVAVPGHLWDANKERGVHKTTDGGKTWQQILAVDENTGCADLAMDPQEPTILYAAMWEHRRKPYFFTSGGAGSGLYKTTDGGKNWRKLAKDLPAGNLGRIAIAVAPARPSFVYAIVESEKTALYRSEDLGESWRQVSTSPVIAGRPFYFSLLIVDPKDYKTIYKPGYSLVVSKDGGETFSGTSLEGMRVHPDLHALWINPQNPNHLLLGTDGGIYVSFDRGNRWIFLNSLPISQFYHVSVDQAKPYNVYGGLQDNGSWYGPSKSPSGIEDKDWVNVGMGDGFYVFPDPIDEDVIYCEYQGGNILRKHKSTGETKSIRPYAGAGEPELRFNWNTPIALSPNHPGVMYVGAQFLFRSTDQGESWQRISGDLTTNDPQKQKQKESGGLTVDNSTAENHCTIYTICESPVDENIIWAGTDDGNVQVSWDGGKSWHNVVGTIPNLPANTWCSCIEAGHHDRNTAYAVFDGHQTGDMNVYVYKTTDLGETWQSITTAAITGYVHVIREDLVNPNLLFVGTEFGLYISVDGGDQWAQFTGDLPPVAVRDIVIHPGMADVILATHGRGIYIIDNISPLRQITHDILVKDVHFFEPTPAKITIPVSQQHFPGDAGFVGSNPAEVVTILYYLKKRHMFGDMKLEIFDADNNLVKMLPGGKRSGINRVYWNMRLKPPRVPSSPQLAGYALFGPMVKEGTYTVKLTKGKDEYTSTVRVIQDPDSPHSVEDRSLQQQTVWQLYEMQDQLAYIAAAITRAHDQAKESSEKLTKNDGFRKILTGFAEELGELHKTLLVTQTGVGITGEQKLREKIVELYGAVSNYGGKPTTSQLNQVQALAQEIEKANTSFNAIVEKRLPKINSKLEGKKMEVIRVLTRKEWEKEEE